MVQAFYALMVYKIWVLPAFSELLDLSTKQKNKKTKQKTAVLQ